MDAIASSFHTRRLAGPSVDTTDPRLVASLWRGWPQLRHQSCCDPCGGGGALIDQLCALGLPAHGTDVAPRRNDIGECDVFDLKRVPPDTSCLITNLPSSPGGALSTRIARHLVNLIVGTNHSVALLVRIAWIAAANRRDLAQSPLLDRVVVPTFRPTWDFEPREGGRIAPQHHWGWLIYTGDRLAGEPRIVFVYENDIAVALARIARARAGQEAAP